MSIASAAAVALVAAILLVGSDSAWRGVPGFVLAIVAVPTLPMTGIPVMGGATRWFVALITSAALWFVIGAVAARRSSRRQFPVRRGNISGTGKGTESTTPDVQLRKGRWDQPAKPMEPPFPSEQTQTIEV